MSASPDQSALRHSIESPDFIRGVALKYWKHIDTDWPYAYFGIKAADEKEFILRCECSNFPDTPAVELWDLEMKNCLEQVKRPRGIGDVAMVFRCDWENGRHLYHPHDRVAANSHPEWAIKNSRLTWRREKGMPQLLIAVHNLLNGDEYGVH